jgi:predicted DCC family thiol-disulfide oxidoreductase YuxK
MGAPEKGAAMISLVSRYTDAKGRRARGWLFYDAECTFCARCARWVAPILRRRGLGVAPLQDPRVSDLLNTPLGELMLAIRYLDERGEQFCGADAIIAIAREIWWAVPLLWFAKFPCGMRWMRSGYAWVAARRSCTAVVCLAESKLKEV